METVLYARFSPRHNQETSESADMQLLMLESYALGRGWTVASKHKDEAKSGMTTMGRDGLVDALSALGDLPRGSSILVHDLSRLSRDVVDSRGIWDSVLQAGHSVEEMNGPGIHGDQDLMVGTIRTAVHEQECRDKAKKISQFMRRYSDEGRLMGSPSRVPYGFQYEPGEDDAPGHRTGKVVVNEDEQEIIALAKELVAGGESLNNTGKMLAEMGLLSRTGKPLSHRQIGNIVKAERDPYRYKKPSGSFS